MQERITRTEFIESTKALIADKADEELESFFELLKETQDEKGIKLLDEILERELRNRKAEKIRSITKHMILPFKFYLEVNDLWNYEDSYDKSFNLIDIFNYGYMMGVRTERAKRKANN